MPFLYYKWLWIKASAEGIHASLSVSFPPLSLSLSLSLSHAVQLGKRKARAECRLGKLNITLGLCDESANVYEMYNNVCGFNSECCVV